MWALLSFHGAVGVRLAVRSFNPLFAAMLAAVMLQMYPAELVKGIARRIYTPGTLGGGLLPVAALAFLLPAWAVPRLVLGVNGWLRHLPLSDSRNRRGLELALVAVQLPLIVVLAILGLVAHSQGLPVWHPVPARLVLLLCAGGAAAMPGRRQWLQAPLALGAAWAATYGPPPALIPALLALVIGDLAAGPVRRIRSRRRSELAWTLGLGLARRAVGWRLIPAYLLGLLPVGAAALFVANNEPGPGIAAAAYRLGIGLGIAAFIAVTAGSLAARRPVWPWMRSLPWSSLRRTAEDAAFLGVCSLPIVALGTTLHPGAAMASLAFVPALALRASGAMRRSRRSRTGLGPFPVEGTLAAALAAMVPSSAALALLAAPLAFRAARNEELRQKVTCWQEAHHASAGDSLSWSE